jgi:hypothetical protein
VLGAVAEPAHEAGAILRIIGVGARVDVHQVVFERAMDEDGQLARSGGDGFGPPDAEGYSLPRKLRAPIRKRARAQ